ncbi:MAG: MOSC domain-containing protein [Pseudomonadota bacterium]
MRGTLGALTRTHAAQGSIEWIGLRPARKAEMMATNAVTLGEAGLPGDHAKSGNRAVTLIQAEHLPVIALLAGLNEVTPHQLRRNIVVSGINLIALRNVPLRLGEALIELTAPCPPCSRMETALGLGGYNAMRGHGGWYAKIIRSGEARIGGVCTPIYQTP